MPTIIADTDSLLVLNKPAGLITHSDGRTLEPSVAEWIAEHYPRLRDVGEPWVSPQGESIRVCGLVHRLDRPTSGVLIAAKSPEMYAHLKSEFKARRIAKTYRALVHGHVENDAGHIVAAIERTTVTPKHWYAKPCEESHVRAAITDYRVLSRACTPDGELYSIVELSPKTGRTHQIRVHMASIGHPLVGDALYAPDMPALVGYHTPALHAYTISLSLPDGTAVHYEAPLPAQLTL